MIKEELLTGASSYLTFFPVQGNILKNKTQNHLIYAKFTWVKGESCYVCPTFDIKKFFREMTVFIN